MLRFFLLITVVCLVHLCCRADDQSLDAERLAKEAELALEGFVLPEGIRGSLLAASPSVSNPVAFHITSDGRVFLCETYRRDHGVEDNRNHMDWLVDDLRSESVEQRLAMFRKHLGPRISEYTEKGERIRLLQDTTGDGKLDQATVFADGFNDALDGIGAGVLEHNGKVYYTCIPKLWMLQDDNADGVADQYEALHHGYGVRVAFRGHDLHGLRIGPDGRLYFSIGDRGYNVITKEVTRLTRPDSGAVFRCDLDGSHLEVFAYGLRNPQELAFDNHGNLFTVDNNSDGGDKARLTYLVRDSDTGWRMYFQYLPDRGPWNRERMWSPYQSDAETTAVQPAPIVPAIINLADGPSGFTFYPGLGLSDRYADHFFLADFRGTPGNSGIRSFSVQPKGASYELTDSHQFVWSVLATDVDFAADGSLYVSDWVEGWNGQGQGRMYRFEDPEHRTAVTQANVVGLLNGGIADTTTEELLTYLKHPDLRVRQQAQFALVDRDAWDLVLKWATGELDETTNRHVAWALWQFGLQSPERASQVADTFLAVTSAKKDLVEQHLKIVSDLARRHGLQAFLTSDTRMQWRKIMAHLAVGDDIRQIGFAAEALGAIGRTADLETLMRVLEKNADADPVVRHQAVMGLVRIEQRSPQSLQAFVRHPAAPVRKALVLAFNRLDNTRALIQFLRDEDVYVATEAARALTDERTGVAEPELASLLNDRSLTNELARRCLEAAYRLGDSGSAAAVAQVAASNSQDHDLRIVAVKMLKTWDAPEQTNTVNGRWRKLLPRETPGLNAAVQSHLAGMLAGPDDVRQSAVELAAQLGVTNIVPTLKAMLNNSTDEDVRVTAFLALSNLSTNVDELLAKGQADASEAVRLASLELLAARDSAAAVPELAKVVDSGSITAKQSALRLLGQIKSAESSAVLEAAFESLDSGKLPRGITLDLLQAATENSGGKLPKLVADWRTKQKNLGTKLAEWDDCLEGGDAVRGRALFFGGTAASCRRCHKIDGNGTDVGPDLSVIGQDKDRSYLLEALVDPNAKIAKGFETTIIVDIDGRIHSGIIKEETDSVVRLMTPQATLVSVAKDDIDERVKGQSGMPADIVRGLSREDVRDLVEFLAGRTAVINEHPNNN
jgi:quinoprotein glucose dehydrogenase